MPKVIKDFCSDYDNLPLNTQILLRFKLDGTYQRFGGSMYVVTLTCSNKSITLSTKSVFIEEGWFFLTNIHSPGKGIAVVESSVYGTPSGRFQFNFLDSKDVFTKAKYDLLMSELKYVSTEVNDPNHHSEYNGNYCMGAAERGLSELMGDITNFYAVERTTQKHKNKISFSGKNAISRGKHFQALGLTEAFHEFNSYKINHTKKDLIYKSKDEPDARKNYDAVKYDIIELTKAAKDALTKFFDDDLKNKELGYHIYYFTVTDGFHTLLLIIDKLSNPCKSTYEIWDQHGISSSSGLYTEIAEGIRRQTSWTFANSCLNRYITKKTDKYDSTKTYLWKMKQK